MVSRASRLSGFKVEDKLPPKEGYTLLTCTVCGQNFGVAQVKMADTEEIVVAHMKNHDNVFYLVTPSKKKVG